MGGFDLDVLAKAVSAVKPDKLADGMFKTLQNGQDNKTRRYESDNKRQVELKKNDVAKLGAAARAVDSAGNFIEKTGRAYRDIQAVKADQEKAYAARDKAQADLENAKNEGTKNENQHTENMHKIDLTHQEVMDSQQKNYESRQQDNERIKEAANEIQEDIDILRQRMKDRTMSNDDAEMLNKRHAEHLELAKHILENRK